MRALVLFQSMNVEDYPEFEALKAIYGDKIRISSENDGILLQSSVSVRIPGSVPVHLFLPCKENPMIPSASTAVVPVDELKINFGGMLPDSYVPNFERSVSGLFERYNPKKTIKIQLQL